MSLEQLREIFVDELMSTTDVVKYLKITRQTLYRRINDGVFPEPIRISKRTQYYIKSEIKKYIRDCEAKGVPV